MTINQSENDQPIKLEDAYIERCNKETDELLAEENNSFLNQGITYFKDHLDEFMYLESDYFREIGVDGICLEMDSVFKKYDVMLGIKKQKKFEKAIKSFLSNQLENGETGYDLLFNSNEGIWDLNFSLNGLNTFHEEWTIQQAYYAIYQFLLQLIQEIEG